MIKQAKDLIAGDRIVKFPPATIGVAPSNAVVTEATRGNTKMHIKLSGNHGVWTDVNTEFEIDDTPGPRSDNDILIDVLWQQLAKLQSEVIELRAEVNKLAAYERDGAPTYDELQRMFDAALENCPPTDDKPKDGA